MAIDTDESFGYGNSGINKLMGLGQLAAGAFTGDPMLMAQGAGGLSNQGSPGSKAFGMANAAGSIAGSFGGGGESAGDPTGSRGSSGEANLGMNTDFGYGDSHKSWNPDQFGNSLNTVQKPSLGYGMDTMSRRMNSYGN